ncbi:TetR/AcrR family transcriptional regulator [Crossiella cryophila]|uniref:AcrR family transcriptional regulator n=1 Tax=Crossiella cryophila TaxID=43355 RepID=A0A7W7FVI1_9PSEU|nr:TetR/AcrR family transcriptional regulator [Crossiella cryophila]MBB4678518.1 AcrR family transcriptional regulator [Crossiella cryophila]
MRRDARANLERLLTAAAEVFAEQGLDATLADAAKRAEVGVGTVYRRFANKDDLIHEVYAPRLREVEQLAEQAAAAPDAWQGFADFFESSIRQLAADRGLRELTLGGHTQALGWARGTPPDRLAALIDSTQQAMGGHLDTMVRRAQEAGALRADFVATDMMLLSVAVQATIALGGAEHPELSRRALGFILDGLRPERDGPTALPAPPLTPEALVRIRQRGLADQ